MKTFAFVILSVLLLCFGLAACGGNRDIERQLDRADAIMDSAPDTALMLLDSMCADSLGGGQRARYGLLYTKAATKNRTPLADDSLIGMAVDYYAGRGDSLEIQSLYYQGEVYSYAGVLDTALVSLHNAYEKALAAGDSFYAAMSAREIAAIYGRLLIPRQQLWWAEEAKRQFGDASRPVHAAWMDIMISAALILTHDYEGAERLLNRIDTAQYNSSRTFRHKILLNKVELAAHRHAHKHMVELFDTLINDGYRMTAHDYCRIAEAEMTSGNYANTGACLGLIDGLPFERSDSIYFNKVKGDYLSAVGDYRGSNEAYARSAAAVMKYEGEMVTNPQTALLTDTLRFRIAEEKSKAERRRELTVILIALCVILLALGVMVVLYLRTRLANKSLEADKAFNDVLRLKNELALLDKRHEGLATGVGSLFSRHVDMLQNLAVAYYSKSGNGDKDPAFYRGVEATVRGLQSAEVVNELWAVIDSSFEGWMTRFQASYPGLKNRQYLLVMYLYLGLSTEAIAVLLGKSTPQAVYAEKARIKCKMLESNGGVIDDFMRDIKMQSCYCAGYQRDNILEHLPML